MEGREGLFRWISWIVRADLGMMTMLVMTGSTGCHLDYSFGGNSLYLGIQLLDDHYWKEEEGAKSAEAE